MKKILISLLFMSTSIATFAQLKVFADDKADIYRQFEKPEAMLAIENNNCRISHGFQQVAFPKRIPVSKVEHPIFDNEEEGIPPRTTFGAIPQIDYENHTITFYSNTHILSMEVKIKDENGKEVYHNYVSITNGIATINLTGKEDVHAFTIELLYADMHLIGYFIM